MALAREILSSASIKPSYRSRYGALSEGHRFYASMLAMNIVDRLKPGGRVVNDESGLVIIRYLQKLNKPDDIIHIGGSLKRGQVILLRDTAASLLRKKWKNSRLPHLSVV